MQEDKIYEYAVIRLVPKVEREEFFNIGLVMFSKKEKYIRVEFYLCKDKFQLMHSKLEQADTFAKSVLNDEIFRAIVDLIPEDWLHWNDAEETPEEIRDIYFNFLKTRLQHSEIFLNEAQNARG